jgi:hypothetical protein
MFAWKNWHRFAALTAFVGALAFAGCAEKKTDSPKAEGDGNGGQPTPGSAGKDTKPEATYTVKQYLDADRAAQAKNESFPINQHSGKVIELIGVVKGFGSGPGVGSLMFEVDGKTIVCKVTDQPSWTKVLPTQTVTLRGLVARSTADHPHATWQIVSVSGSPPPTLTAEQFIKERRNTTFESLKKKYEPVIVTGIIAEVKTGEDGATEISLNAGEERVLCQFPSRALAAAPLTELQKSALKAGQKVKVLSEFLNTDSLGFCVLLEPAP